MHISNLDEKAELLVAGIYRYDPSIDRCLKNCPLHSWVCTLSTGHTGPHVAHGAKLLLMKHHSILCIWDADDNNS